ncbi:alpha/beta-hydrolase [Eremomyces bilateralis CBS 781.70]|uniref:Alpha/beta-hydrolase n=1 Tax=Eremomyces bilateralis CBS 781.70 TaxID=1392243 RepID=A0A6G1G3K3_9PEZI|nr:alpha/beta-hydrolase [Eremomyces bilateralis CBS 781.70]KAF1812511.1 alpha/beta-hydrolase [Eremomyces bilateralis CBS 781.70]
MSVKPIDPFSDPRITHEYAQLNGQRYHYLYGVPKSGKWHRTIFLIHGFPDISMGWRYQIPVLLELGLRVVAPDMMGYGGTDAPQVPPNLDKYTYKRAADDLAELARQLRETQIILGGHDWGGMIVYRFANWYPNLISHLFSVCTPYQRPNKTFWSTEEFVKGPLPQFGYQLHLASGEIEKNINTPEGIRQFLNGMYGARGPNRESTFDPVTGVSFENLPKVGKTKLLTDREMDYYTQEYSKHGLNGPVSWYRTREPNWRDELSMEKATLDMPILFISATQDAVLTPAMAKNMSRSLTNLTMREVKAQHWALWQKADECNAHIKQWIQEVVLGKQSRL